MITNIKNIKRIKKRKRRTQKTIFSVFLGFLIFSLIIFLFISIWRINYRRVVFNSQIERLYREIEYLRQENIRIKDKITDAGEQDFLERVARERLGLRKPGEEVIIVLSPDGIKPKEEEEIEKNFWQRILERLRFW